MENYIGTKIISAVPMSRLAYNEFRGWAMPADEDGTDAGYLVKYTDGYISWSPKAQFDAAYRRCDALPFGLALEALKRGERVARTGWNGKDMWIALSGTINAPRNIAYENFWSPHASEFARSHGGSAEVLPSIIMKTADDKILMGWLASQTDILAEDWMIL